MKDPFLLKSIDVTLYHESLLFEGTVSEYFWNSFKLNIYSRNNAYQICYKFKQNNYGSDIVWLSDLNYHIFFFDIIPPFSR